MAKEFTHAPEVEDIATRLIEILKPELEGFEIRYVMSSENPKKDGREVIGLARKVTGFYAYLAGGSPDGFFVIETGVPAYEALTPNQKIAYVHHELCHFGITELGALGILPHDIEEFNEIAATHGSYEDSLVIFGAALQKGDGDQASRKELIEQILNG